MGYYSTVAIWANKKAIEAMPEDVKKELLEKDGHFSGSARRYSSGNICWDMGEVKWYGDDIDAIMDWLHSLKAEKGQFYEIMEIGEEGEVTHELNHDQCDKMMTDFRIDITDCN